MKKQYLVTASKIELYVKPPTVIMRYFLLFLGLISLLLPITGILISLIEGKSFHFGFLVGLGVGFLIFFYFYKLFLWNSYGKETIEFNKQSLHYYADYKRFIRNQQTKDFTSLTFAFKEVGYQNEELGVLVILNQEEELLIECATIMPLKELSDLTQNLKGF